MIDERFPQWDIDVEKGTVYSLKFKRFIGSKINKYGYVNVNIYPLHRLIWMVANQCDIPEGYDVHHIDGNPSNNSIHNLDLIKSTKHRSEHKIGKNYSAEHKENISKALKGKKSNFDGKQHSDETKRIIKDKLTNNPKLSKKVGQYTLDGELVKVWDSTMECGRNGYNYGCVAACCRGVLDKHKNHVWRYI